MTVNKAQKLTRSNPCPVCNGYDLAPRGKGERCYGFGSDDGKFAHCTRDEHGGGLPKNPNSDTYSHYLVGTCNCGINHIGSFTAPAPTHRRSNYTADNKQVTIDYDNPDAIYKYDHSKTEPFEVLRFDLGDGDKTFRQRRLVDGEYKWSVSDITTTLFHQTELENADPDEIVYVVEGEKDVLKLESRKCVAACSPMGAGRWRDHYNEVFTGRTVVIVADNDTPGLEHANQVAAGISPVARSVKIIQFTHLPKGGDMSDFIEAGGTREQLQALVKDTPEYSPPTSDDATGSEWGTMEELPAATPPVPTLPAELVPEPLRPWLEDEASRAPVPLEMFVMPTLSSLGSVIGRQVGIKPERFNNYYNVPNLWGACVSGSGKMKTHAIKEGLSHIKRLEAELAVAHEGDSANREAQQSIIKAEIDNLNRDIKKALDGTDSSKVDRLQLELAEAIERRDKATVPARRFITQDATIEKLGEMLKLNPNGLMVSRDELAGWLQSLEKPGRENDRPFYLESWDGTGGYNVDRIGRGSERIPALTLTVFGGIQPGKLKKYVAEAVGDGDGSDGLLQRVQLIVDPDKASFPEWVEATSYADKDAKNRAWEVYKRLSEINLPNSDENESDKIPTLSFTKEAQALHTAWRTDLEERLRSDAMDATPAFQSHISKYRSLAPSLALIYYLAELPAGEAIGDVTLDALKKALAMCEFLELHASKVYAKELYLGLGSAYALSKKIKSGAVKDAETIRGIYNKGWSELGKSKDVFAAVEVLERHGWVRIDREETGGRPTERLLLNPELLGGNSSD